MRSRILTFVLTLVLAQATAQLHPVLESFDVVQSGEVVEFRFAIKGGASCSGVDLERSSDALKYEIVGVISGVCGGSEFTEFYTINDESPVEGQMVYYRLRLGAQGWSQSQQFTFVQTYDGANVYPNPARDRAQVRIDNPGGNPWGMTVFTANGELWREYDRITGTTHHLDVSDWASGTYLLAIQEGERTWLRRLEVD